MQLPDAEYVTVVSWFGLKVTLPFAGGRSTSICGTTVLQSRLNAVMTKTRAGRPATTGVTRFGPRAPPAGCCAVADFEIGAAAGMEVGAGELHPAPIIPTNTTNKIVSDRFFITLPPSSSLRVSVL